MLIVPDDTYPAYSALARACREGPDYRVRLAERGGQALIFSPHAGGIEPGTSELVEGIAGQDFSYYLFEGVRGRDNGHLHITSHHFDEPRCLEMIGRFETSLAVHGYEKSEACIYIGGRDEALKAKLAAALAGRFSIDLTSDPKLDGKSLSNICNRTAAGAGVQLEFSAGLRRGLFEDWTHASGRRITRPGFDVLVTCIRAALAGR